MTAPIDSLRIEAIWISPGHDFKGRHGRGRLAHRVEARDEVECHAGRGLVGDRYYDYKADFKGQVTLFAAETWEAIRSELKLPIPDPSVFRRNVLTRGIDLTPLVGKRFKLGGVSLEGTEEARPCYWMDEAVGPGACAWLVGRGGLRCRILEDGRLRRELVQWNCE